eukprot:353125-Chlamydomonas_euryale.AAC.3
MSASSHIAQTELRFMNDWGFAQRRHPPFPSSPHVRLQPHRPDRVAFYERLGLCTASPPPSLPLLMYASSHIAQATCTWMVSSANAYTNILRCLLPRMRRRDARTLTPTSCDARRHACVGMICAARRWPVHTHGAQMLCPNPTSHGSSVKTTQT